MPDTHPTELRIKPQIIHCHQLATCDLPDDELVFTECPDCLEHPGLAELQGDRPFACNTCLGYGCYHLHVPAAVPGTVPALVGFGAPAKGPALVNIGPGLFARTRRAS